MFHKYYEERREVKGLPRKPCNSPSPPRSDLITPMKLIHDKRKTNVDGNRGARSFECKEEDKGL